MKKRKKIGIGISDFRELREGNFLYIDKTPLISEIIEAGAKVLLIPRPRRFGKTLNLSMLRYFFERHETAEETARHAKLFDGLIVRDTPEFKEQFARYPVIFLTFKDIKEQKFSDALYAMTSCLDREIWRHIEKPIDDIAGSTREALSIDIIRRGEATINHYKESILALSTVLHKLYGKPPVVLIDEYDTPIHAAWQYGYYDEMISFMRGLLSGAFKDNPHIYKGVITGILRVAKESIFSDLNNLDIYTILEQPFSTRFGITPDELRALFSLYGMEDRLDEADSWYNGYTFGTHTMFNPWSILNFINQAPPRPEPYWANTSSNVLIRDLIVDGGLEVREKIEKLIAGKTIDSVIDKNIVFPDLRKKTHYIYSLFFFSGYLKCVEEIPEPRKFKCKLAIPNEEVRYIFESIIAGWLEESFGNTKLMAMLKALVNGNIDQFQRLLNEFVLTTLSFFDAKGKNPEAVFQAFVLGMLLNLGSEYEISSNRELGYGRYDILAVHKTDRTRPAILIEMKSITGFYKEEPEKAIQEAIEQIGTRAYAKELEAQGFSNVLKIVVVSNGKKVWVRVVE